MTKIVDEWGEPVKTGRTYQARNGSWFEVTEFDLSGTYPVGAVFEGGDMEESGDFYRPAFFGFTLVEDSEKEGA